MYVYLYVDWIDYAEEAMSRIKWGKEKRKPRRTKFRRPITWECYIMYKNYAFMYRFVRVENVLAT